uniref:Signal peptidase complex subunit 2 n=1 Tax=Tabanus bromius TaxID=304241 RepID=A0A0K8TSU6_TABBR
MSSKPKKDEKKENDKDAEPVKVNKWDGSAVKHALDDAVKNALLDHPNCTEDFKLIDGRLFICTLAVGIALAAIAFDYKYPFPQSRPVLMLCVISYFIFMGILTLYTTFKEKGIFAVAIQKDSNGKKVWNASSEMKKYDDKYTLVLTVKDSKSLREASISKSCAAFIDVNGIICENLVTNEVNRLYNSLNSDKNK